MNNDKLKLPDDLFKQGLDGYEAPYNEGAWEDMRDLLDKSDRKLPFLLWFRRNKKTTLTLITITMITTTIISFWALLNTGAITKTSYTKAEQKDVRTEKTIVKRSDIVAQANPQVNTTGENFTAQNAANYAGSSNAKAPSNQVVTDNGTTNSAPVEFANGVESNTEKPAANASTNTEKAQPAVATECAQVAKTAATNEPEKAGEKTGDPKKGTGFDKPGIPAYTTFRGPWIGIHFTLQDPEFPTHMDSGRQQAGFNLQFMSQNLWQNRNFGAYLGGDFGAQFYGRGKSYGVVLNNSSLDSGFTRLSMHSFDFLARGHFEYARFALKPYVNLFAGPRIYSTSQYVEAYHHKTEYENSTNTNAHTSVSFMYGGALGMRLAVSRHVSLDARVEYMRGTTTQVVDLDKSAFEGGLTTFSLSKFSLDPAYYQFKFGVLFDLWDGYIEEEHKREPDNSEVTETREYYYFDSSTNQYIRVNCGCKETPAGSDTAEEAKTTRGQYRNEVPVTRSERYNSRGRGYTPDVYMPRGGSGSSGSGRGSFPGIKSGGSGIKIRN